MPYFVVVRLLTDRWGDPLPVVDTTLPTLEQAISYASGRAGVWVEEWKDTPKASERIVWEPLKESA